MESITITGLDELQKKIETLSDEYPDKAEELLIKSAKGLRKNIVNNLKQKVKKKKLSKKPLRRASAYKLEVHGYNSGQSVDIIAKAPHFHLIEHGHVKIHPYTGENLGYIPGYHMFEEELSKYDFEKDAEKMLDELLKEANLL